MTRTRQFPYTAAKRTGTKIRLGMAGPSGSGKTFTSLSVATALSAKTGDVIGVIDTERKRATDYSPPFEFRHYRWPDRDYAQNRMIACLAEAAEDGTGIIIIDSGSPFWSGPGGMRDAVDKAQGAEGNPHKLSGWSVMRPVEEAFWDAVHNYPGHIIMSFRVKTDYQISGAKVTKLGLAPEARNGIEYDFGIFGELDMGQRLTISTTNIQQLNGTDWDKPGAEFAQVLVDWLGQAPPARTAMDFMTDLGVAGLDYTGALKHYRDLLSDQLSGAAVIAPDTGELTKIDVYARRRVAELWVPHITARVEAFAGSEAEAAALYNGEIKPHIGSAIVQGQADELRKTLMDRINAARPPGGGDAAPANGDGRTARQRRPAAA